MGGSCLHMKILSFLIHYPDEHNSQANSYLKIINTTYGRLPNLTSACNYLHTKVIDGNE